MLIAMGDCAVAGNVPSMRNQFGVQAVNERAFFDTASLQQQVPCKLVPKLHARVRPVHEFVPVDVFLPGCPPSADTFYTVLTELLAGKTPDISSLTRFGA
jgi:NAD-reducing hydrogenase small subunit